MIEDYTPRTAIEQDYHAQICALIADEKNAFQRTCFPAHITGSAILISKDGQRVLLNHHKSLHRWLSFGGHADGDTNILNVARRETEEESGITNFELLSDGIADVDIHTIPANAKRGEPEHDHYDIRFIFRCTGDETFQISDESTDLRWMTYDEAQTHIKKPDGLERLLDKWQKLVTHNEKL